MEKFKCFKKVDPTKVGEGLGRTKQMQRDRMEHEMWKEIPWPSEIAVLSWEKRKKFKTFLQISIGNHENELTNKMDILILEGMYKECTHK